MALLGFLWLGVTAWVVGIFTLSVSVLIRVVLLVGGSLATIGVLTAMRWRFGASGRLLLGFLMATLGKVVATAANLWLAYRSLGGLLDLEGAFIVSSSAVLATAVGFFPGGLGIREILSSALAGAGGYDGPTAVLATALERVGWLIGLAGAWAVGTLMSTPLRHRRVEGGS
jgi:uncharacterized membrane protein YbhN (UPF0104 family)